MNPQVLKNKLYGQVGFLTLGVLLLSAIWELALKESMMGMQIGSAPWLEISANVGIVLLAAAFPTWYLFKSADSATVSTEVGATERRYQRIVESTNDIILQIDAEGKIIYANPAVRLLGYLNENLEGTLLSDLLYMDEPDKVLPRITTKRVGHRATYNCPVQLKTSADSVLSSEVPAIEFIMDACGIWEEPDYVVQTRGVDKKFLGTLCIARPVVDRSLLDDME